MGPEKIAKSEAEDFRDLTPQEREVVARRAELVASVAEARRQFAAGECQPMSAAEIVAEAQQDTP